MSLEKLTKPHTSPTITSIPGLKDSTIQPYNVDVTEYITQNPKTVENIVMKKVLSGPKNVVEYLRGEGLLREERVRGTMQILSAYLLETELGNRVDEEVNWRNKDTVRDLRGKYRALHQPVNAINGLEGQAVSFAEAYQDHVTQNVRLRDIDPRLSQRIPGITRESLNAFEDCLEQSGFAVDRYCAADPFGFQKVRSLYESVAERILEGAKIPS